MSDNLDSMSWERVVPDALDPQITFQKKVLQQHLERYRLAMRYVQSRKVIDGACGSGYGSAMLRDAGATSVVGLDVDTEALKYARENYLGEGIEFYLRDLENCDLTQWACDVFVSFETIEHLQDPSQFISAVRKLLPSDGLFIASVPTVPTVDIDEFHRHDFTEESWRALVASCGFRIVEEFPQYYTASFSELREELAARNTTSGARRNPFLYYCQHPVQALKRLYSLRYGGLRLDMLTLVCLPSEGHDG